MSVKIIEKILLFLMIIMFFLIVKAETVKNIGDDYRFSLTYTDTSGSHQTGENIVLSIQRSTDGYWFDFNDETFKNSSWTSKTVNLTEDSTNHNYYYLWDSQGGEVIVNSYLFHVELTDSFIREETISFQNLGSSDFDNTSDQVIVDTNNDKTGYFISGTTTTLDELKTYGDLNWITATGFSTHSADDIWLVSTRTLTEFSFNVDVNSSSIDLIWDELLSGHAITGSTGKALSDSGLAGNPWTTDISTGYEGQAGEVLRNSALNTDGLKTNGEYQQFEKLVIGSGGN